MPTLWRTAGGLVYAGSGKPDPFSATYAQLVACCCSPSPSLSPSPSPSPPPSVSPSPSPTFPAYYCVKYWIGGTCDGLSCQSADCLEIASQAVYDAYQFGVCVDYALGGKEMHTTDNIPHATFTACSNAGCVY